MYESYEERLIRKMDEAKEIDYLEDGFLYYFPVGHSGAMTAHDLRVIADELDRRNKPWEDQIEKDYSEGFFDE